MEEIDAYRWIETLKRISTVQCNQVSSFDFAQSQGKLNRLRFLGGGRLVVIHVQESCCQSNQDKFGRRKNKTNANSSQGWALPNKILTIRHRKRQLVSWPTHYASYAMPARKLKAYPAFMLHFCLSKEVLCNLLTWTGMQKCKVLILSSNG